MGVWLDAENNAALASSHKGDLAGPRSPLPIIGVGAGRAILASLASCLAAIFGGDIVT